MELLAITISTLALGASCYALLQTHRAQAADQEFKKINEVDLRAKQAPKIQVVDERIDISRPRTEGHPVPPEEQILIKYSAVLHNKGSEVAQLKSITLEVRPLDEQGKEASYGLGALVIGSVYLAVNETLRVDRDIDSAFLMFVRNFGDFEKSPLVIRAIFKYSGYAGVPLTHKTGLLRLSKENKLQGHGNWNLPRKEPRTYPLIGMEIQE